MKGAAATVAPAITDDLHLVMFLTFKKAVFLEAVTNLVLGQLVNFASA